jgi:hypothetical protein
MYACKDRSAATAPKMIRARAEIPQHFQKFALILRRTFPRHAPLRVSDHPPIEAVCKPVSH